ncbi:MAG TPA: hypothetical protein VJO53_14470 [Candidatus Acidoferrales bacterium]|nr:hypothetical protein [Candidatus Acidoferrales bacterium]
MKAVCGRATEPSISKLSRTSRPHALPQFWQRRFYDFNVWSRKKMIEKLAYMHANPLKRALVKDPKDWPWSSYSFDQGRGEVLIAIAPVG